MKSSFLFLDMGKIKYKFLHFTWGFINFFYAFSIVPMKYVFSNVPMNPIEVRLSDMNLNYVDLNNF